MTSEILPESRDKCLSGHVWTARLALLKVLGNGKQFYIARYEGLVCFEIIHFVLNYYERCSLYNLY